MKIEEAEQLVCPFINLGCIHKRCMMWVETTSGKKEIARFKMPYDIYPSDEGIKHRQLISDGYIEANDKVYIKYESDCFEGYCSLKESKDVK